MYSIGAQIMQQHYNPFHELLDAKYNTKTEEREAAALAFITMAERIEQIKDHYHDIDMHTRNGILDANNYLWLLAKNLVAMDTAPKEYEDAELLSQIGTFTGDASAILAKENNESILQQLIQLNINMADSIIAMIPDHSQDTTEDKFAVAS